MRDGERSLEADGRVDVDAPESGETEAADEIEQGAVFAGRKFERDRSIAGDERDAVAFPALGDRTDFRAVQAAVAQESERDEIAGLHVDRSRERDLVHVSGNGERTAFRKQVDRVFAWPEELHLRA